jgi:hypothetical protein
MNKNIYFEKVGKLTLSVILTSVLITWAVIAATTFTNWQVLDSVDLNNAFDEKVSVTSIPTCATDEYLTTDASWFKCKKLTDNTLTQSDILSTISTSCKICLSWSDSNLPLSQTYKSSKQKGSCVSLNSTSFASVRTSWDVDGNDNFWVKVVCSGWTWSTVSVNSASSCSPSHNITEKSGTCFAWDTNTYYWGTKTNCTFNIPYAWGGSIPGFIYSKRYNQTCN